MTYVVDFARFWYDFVVGDDWTIAAIVVVTLAVLIALAHAHLNLWWLLPIVVIASLGFSLWRAAGAE